MNPTRIIIHHSATKDSGTVSWSAIRRYHIFDRGWVDIGYHAGIEMVNDELECLYGRPATEQGAHTSGYNHDSLGFCFVGNYDIDTPDQRMLYTAARRVILPWCRQFGIAPENIYGHNQFSTKTCPGKLFPLDDLRGLVIAGLLGR